LGGGFELLLACDIKIMNKKAILRFPELSLGLIPGFGGTQRIIRLIGATRAKEAVLLSDQISAEKALDWGIVNIVTEPDKFEATVNDIAKKLGAGAPLAQKLAKAALFNGAQADQRTGVYLESSLVGDVSLSSDLAEGITAMTSRRNPKFTGQ
jgi:enoyl-CoA hydratase/carnithine racemase